GFVEQVPQPRAPAQVGQPADDAAGCGTVADLSAHVHAELAQPGGPLLARRELHSRPHQPLSGVLRFGFVDVGADVNSGAVVAATAALALTALRIVALTASESPPAAVRV